MKFGVHSFVWNDAQETSTLLYGLERARAAGYDFFELPGFDRARVDIPLVAREAQALGIELGASCGLAPEHDVSSLDPAVFRAGEAVLNEAVAIARDLGSRGMSGPIFSGHQKYRVMPTRANWETSVAVLTRVAERAKAAGVTLSMELVNRYETNLMNTVKQGLAYIADTGADNLLLHIDTFHMNIEEEDMGQAIRLAGDRIGYFHVGESNRGHLGSGSIDFAKAFDALVATGYDRVISVEAFSTPGCGDWLKAICAIWRENWREPDSFARDSLDFMRRGWLQAQRRSAAYAG